MKNLKNLLSVLAFVFAIGSVFAFSTPKIEKSAFTQDAKKAGECTTIYQISNDCVLNGAGQVCKIPLTDDNAVDPQASTSNCSEADVFALDM